MKVVTASEMQEIDRKTIEEIGISGIVLMERAGVAVVTKIKEHFGRKRVIVLSGRGNNGGDGIVVARCLHNEGWEVKVFLSSRREDLRGDALAQYSIARNCGVSIDSLDQFITRHSSVLSRHSLFVDALLGTGLDKNISGKLSEAITIMRESNLPVLSIDIPSGISSDNGQIMGNAVKADCTVTFGLPKRGHLLYPGAEYTGRLFIENIGFPQYLLSSEKISTDVVDREYAVPLIPVRPNYSYKGNYGHVLVIAGSKGKTGAALMTAKACLRTGAGLVTLGVPESLADVFQSRVTEEMILPLPDINHGFLSRKALKSILDFLHDKADILAIGPGIGISAETKQLMVALIANAGIPMVIDADGINSIQGGNDPFLKAKAPVILTPHPGEMAGLLSEQNNMTIQTIEKDRISTARSFARQTKTHLILKGVPTVTAAPDGKAFINTTGNPGMASGGVGDVLTGMIAGLLGQNITPLQACIIGVYLHGLAGDIASSEKGPHSLIATDIIEKIPSAFLSLKNNG
jgi:ADP-dependent NAD(P)H-hydrate dehydratase / NAD(P)H-hydrate epimerase